MSRLRRAMELANSRKVAGLGSDSQPEGMIVTADSEAQDRAIFSGFDIGYDELVGTSTEVASLYSHAASTVGLRPLFISAWCDGLLTGLLMASLPPTPSPGDNEVTGEGGNVRECIETSSGWCFTHNQPYATCNGHELH